MRKALESLPGVANVEADVSNETATITVEKGTFDAAKVAEALAGAGFEGSTVVKASGPAAEGDTKEEGEPKADGEPTEDGAAKDET